MMSSWPVVKLSETCAKPQYGAIARGTDQPIGPRLVRQTDLVDGRINWSTVPYCNLRSSELEKYALQPDDLLIARLGSVGRAARVRVTDVDGAVFAGYLVRFRAHVDRADPTFLSYQLQSTAWWHYVESVRSGAVQPTLNAKQMGEYRFALPPLKEQRRIAGMLSVLDELIDTNRRLIARLVQQADAVANSASVDGDNTTFGEVCDVFGGATPRSSEPSYWNGDLCWATPSDLTALTSPYLFSTGRRITDAGLNACSSKLHPSGSILMTSRATIGIFALAEAPVATNQGFIVVEPREPTDRYFLLHEMRRRVPEFLERANGSTFMELSRGTFKALVVRWPSDERRHEIARLVSPLHRAAVELELEVAKVVTCRRELLPLLMSGRVCVGEAAELLAG